MQKLTDQELQHALASTPGWLLAGGKLTREWIFPDFAQAMVFVNRIAVTAEAAGHHPDIDIRYNRVTLGLVTHDAGGITAADARMASRIDGEL